MLKIAPIKKEDATIDCGKEDINTLMNSAYIATLQKQGYAFNAFFENEIVAQVMLTMTMVGDSDRNSFPGDRRFGCIKIEYVAVAEEWQHQGIGTVVMKYSIKYIREHCSGIPIRFLLLDSVQDKKDWYSSMGFCAAPSHLDLEYTDDYTIPMCIDFMDADAVQEYEDWYTSG